MYKLNSFKKSGAYESPLLRFEGMERYIAMALPYYEAELTGKDAWESFLNKWKLSMKVLTFKKITKLKAGEDHEVK